MGTTGTVRVIKGGEAIIGSGSALNWPVFPANVAVIGSFKVVNAHASNTFTMGTTALDATSVTYVAYNYCVAPTLLQVA